LRYLPMAALYDGRHYMVERYENVLFTPESYGHMVDARLTNGSAPSVLAMGLSKSYGGLPALPGVMPELDAVVHDPAVPESHGSMEGKLLRNEQFTLAALKRSLAPATAFPGAHCQPLCRGDRQRCGTIPHARRWRYRRGDGLCWDLSEMRTPRSRFMAHAVDAVGLQYRKDYTSRNGWRWTAWA